MNSRRTTPVVIGFLMTFGSSLALAQSPQGTWHGEREGVRFFPSGENLAYDRPAPTVHPDLTAHSQNEPRVVRAAKRVRDTTGIRYDNDGFRVARTLPTS